MRFEFQDRFKRVRHRRATFLGMAALCSLLVAGVAPAAAPAVDGPEWQHALWVAGQLRDDPPDTPVVLLLGGSCAREATVNDVKWAADVESRGGYPVAAYNLGSRRQTFEQELAYVKALPRIPMLIFIGVSLGRFTSDPTTTTSLAPPAVKPTFYRHHYKAPIWTVERKQERISYWLQHRYHLFQDRYPADLARLDKMVSVCVQRGYLPVVLALPRNIAVIGDALDEPTDRYLDDCRKLAKRHDIPFLDFVPDLRLPNEDFYDIEHLIGPGRAKYQARLSDETVRLLAAGWKGSPPISSQRASFASDPRTLVPLVLGVLIVAAGVALAVRRRRASR